MKKTKEKLRNSTLLIVIFGVLLVFLVFVGILFYGFGLRDNVVVEKTASIIPFPSAMGSNFWLTRSELEKRKDAVVHFYENQDFGELGLRVDFSTQEGKKRLLVKEKDILDRMIEDEIIEKLARKRGIRITSSDVSQAVDRKIGEYSSGDYLRENMDKLYGWDLDDFEEKIVRPDLYKENLFNYVENSESDFTKSKDKIEKADLELKKGGDFSEVAKDYSEGDSGSAGGDLGWFSKDQIVSGIAEDIFSLKVGETSGVLESSLGFHIVNMEDRKNESDTEMVKIRQIFVRKEDFGDWLSAQKKNFKIFVTEPGLRWNKDEGYLEFKDEEMRKYETSIKSGTSGDASLIF